MAIGGRAIILVLLISWGLAIFIYAVYRHLKPLLVKAKKEVDESADAFEKRLGVKKPEKRNDQRKNYRRRN